MFLKEDLENEKKKTKSDSGSIFTQDAEIFSQIKNTERNEEKEVKEFLESLKYKTEIKEKDEFPLKSIRNLQKKVENSFEKFYSFLKKNEKLNLKKRSQKFDKEIYKIIKEISTLHKSLVEKLPPNLKKSHEAFVLDDILKDFYEELTYTEMKQFSTLLAFEKLLLEDFLIILGENESMKQFLEGAVGKFEKNVDIEMKDLEQFNY